MSQLAKEAGSWHRCSLAGCIRQAVAAPKWGYSEVVAGAAGLEVALPVRPWALQQARGQLSAGVGCSKCAGLHLHPRYF